MSDRVHLDYEVPPWAPPESEIVTTFLEYDVPLAGILRQSGMKHLFLCLEGHVDVLSLWVYARVEPRDITRLKSSTAEDFLAIAEEILQRRSVVSALAHNDGVIFWTTLEEGGNRQEILNFARTKWNAHVREIKEAADEPIGRSVEIA